MGIFSIISALLNPWQAAQNVTTAAYEVACSTAMEKARLEEQVRQQKCEWWSRYGVLVGAGTVIGVLVLKKMTEKKE